MVFLPPDPIEDALPNYGVLTDTANIILEGSNTAQQFAAEVFNRNFTTCLYIEFSEL